MCDPHGEVCSIIEKKINKMGFKPTWEPVEHIDSVLDIATCASQKTGHTTYYPYRSIGWSGYPEYSIKKILRDINKWKFVERGFKGKSGFQRPLFMK